MNERENIKLRPFLSLTPALTFLTPPSPSKSPPHHQQMKSIGSFHNRILNKVRRRIYQDGAKCLVACQDNQENGVFETNIVGTVEFSGFDFDNTSMEDVGDPRKLYIADLAVHRDVRRLGVASGLLRAIELYAKEHAYHEAYLHVEKDNHIAKRFYFKHGYNEVLTDKDWDKKFTLARLQRPADDYIFLVKSFNAKETIVPTLDLDTALHPPSSLEAETALQQEVATALGNAVMIAS